MILAKYSLFLLLVSSLLPPPLSPSPSTFSPSLWSQLDCHNVWKHKDTSCNKTGLKKTSFHKITLTINGFDQGYMLLLWFCIPLLGFSPLWEVHNVVGKKFCWTFSGFVVLDVSLVENMQNLVYLYTSLPLAMIMGFCRMMHNKLSSFQISELY